MKILIVEDDFRKSQIIETYVVQQFHAVIACTIDEQGARSQLEGDGCFDLVLLDMSLPDMAVKGEIDAYGGMNVLSLMEYGNIIIPTIVITGYWDFKNLLTREVEELFYAKNESFRKEIDYNEIETVENFDYLDQMHRLMSYTYPNVYFGSIEFNFYNEVWKKILNDYMEDLKHDGYLGF